MGETRSGNLPEDRTAQPQSRRDFGFSAVELMLVAALLCVVIGSLIPQLLTASENAQYDAIGQDLLQFRRQIEQYTQDHEGRRPAQGTTSGELFVEQLLGRSTHTGVVRVDGRYGPYLIGEIPSNPVSGSSRILVIPGPLRQQHFGGRGDHGWAYSSETGEIRASVATDIVNSDGRPINTL